jgi:hypothetical protein
VTETAYTEQVRETQELINSGTAWKLEGSVGRHAMEMIELGECMLGEEGYRDYWGNYVPSRYEVEDGTKGSESYCVERASLEAQAAHEELASMDKA